MVASFTLKICFEEVEQELVKIFLFAEKGRNFFCLALVQISGEVGNGRKCLDITVIILLVYELGT